MKTDITTYEDIQIFVHRFYDLLAQDEMLKSIFFDRLGFGDWSVHLKRIIDFWDTVLFATANYKGQSFLPHASMNLTQIHFDRWLLLFNQSIDENFEGEKATEAKHRANTMAILFISKINYYKENGGTPLM
jgi:hemoglobin